MLEDTNSLDGAHLIFTVHYSFEADDNVKQQFVD